MQIEVEQRDALVQLVAQRQREVRRDRADTDSADDTDQRNHRATIVASGPDAVFADFEQRAR